MEGCYLVTKSDNCFLVLANLFESSVDVVGIFKFAAVSAFEIVMVFFQVTTLP